MLCLDFLTRWRVLFVLASVSQRSNAFLVLRQHRHAVYSQHLCSFRIKQSYLLGGKYTEHAFDNQQYSRPSQFEKSGGILYRTSIFHPEELSKLQAALAPYKRQLVDETMPSVVKHRRGAVLPANSSVHQIFRDGSLIQWIRSVTENPLYILRDDVIPVEIRSYEQTGACMAWHSDDVLFDPPQLEIVWTLENTSDCVTMWKTNNNSINTVETNPNSVFLIGAGGPEHCVTSLTRGSRFIVKCVYALPDATYHTDDPAVNQFGGGNKSKSKTSKKVSNKEKIKRKKQKRR